MYGVVKDLALLIVGVILGIVGNRLSECYKERNQKRDALQRLDRMLTTVKQAVDHGHDFSNKADWYQELNDLAIADRAWLGQLYEPIKRIAWRIRDLSFDHEKRDAEEYCCDELILDLALLQLKLLPLIPMKSNALEAKAKELAQEVILNWLGVLGNDTTQRVEKFLKHLDEGKVTLDKKYAMSSVLGTGT